MQGPLVFNLAQLDGAPQWPEGARESLETLSHEASTVLTAALQL